MIDDHSKILVSFTKNQYVSTTLTSWMKNQTIRVEGNAIDLLRLYKNMIPAVRSGTETYIKLMDYYFFKIVLDKMLSMERVDHEVKLHAMQMKDYFDTIDSNISELINRVSTDRCGLCEKEYGDVTYTTTGLIEGGMTNVCLSCVNKLTEESIQALSVFSRNNISHDDMQFLIESHPVFEFLDDNNKKIIIN